MKAKKLLFKWAFFATMCFVPSLTFGQTQINNEAELRAIANDLFGNYVLMADITLTSDWTPIGNDDNPFMGIINGNGKAIYGLKFIESTRNGAGFIGTARGATIVNLSLIGAEIYGGQDVGGIVGRAIAPTIVEKCYTSGTFSGYDHIGGIVGGTRSSDPSGEFSKIKDCFSTAAVISTGWQAGGILGTSIDVDVENTYFAGIAGCREGRTGGIVALADGGATTVKNSASIAKMLSGDEVYRVMGSENGHTVTLENNYSLETMPVIVREELSLDGESDKDGRDGEHTPDDTFKTASFYTTTLGWSNSIWKLADGNYPIFPHQSYPLKGDGIFVSSLPARPLPGGTEKLTIISALGRTVTSTSSNPAVATIAPDGTVNFLSDGTTTLTFTTTGDAYSEGATVTRVLNVEGISYEIRTEQDLRNINFDLEGEFTLMNDITVTEDWQPLGKFKGKLNGNGKIIYGLKYDNRGEYRVGLFSEAEGATITKLGIEKAHFVGNGDVGGIVGNAYGCVISECYVADSYIAGRDHVASIAGAMRSYEKIINPGETPEIRERVFTTIINCHSSAEIYSREFQAGGLVGIICGGTIEKCYFSGVIKSENGRAASIVSLVDSDDPGEVKNNINLAPYVYCGENYRIGDWGGRGPSGNYVVEFSNNWSAEQSYFGTELKNSGIKQVYQEDHNRDGRNLPNDDNARSSNFYKTTLGWDFDNVWKFLPNAEGKMFPVLKWQEAPLQSFIYGMPASPYLTWYENSQENISLAKILSNNGEKLIFDIIEGGHFVERDGSFLYVTSQNITEGGITKIKIKKDAALDEITTIVNPDLNIEIIMRDAVRLINTPQDLLNVNNSLFAKFKLMQDIDMSGVEFFGIGSSSAPFTGQFDGDGHAIINAKVKTGGGDKKGFFNATDGAKISNLAVMNFSFEGSATSGGGSADLGGLVGSCKNTTIDQCFLSGHIVGRDHVGGLVGGDCDNVIITNSYVDVTILAERQAGGLFGVTAGSVTIENCYFNGIITLERDFGWAGGIIGLIDKPGDIKISNTVSIGNVMGPGKSEAHIGSNIANANIALFKDNIYNTDAIIENKDGWLPEAETDYVKFPIGQSAIQLKQQSTYTNINWNFTDIWSIEEGVSYPKLKKVSTNVPLVMKENDYLIQTNGATIRVSGIESSASLNVYNISGQQISATETTSDVEITVPAKGIYILRITEKGQVTSMKVICR